MCLGEGAGGTVCCAVCRGKCYWPTEPQLTGLRGLFRGMFRCPGAAAESPYKELLSGLGWKVGYQLHCHSSRRPTRLHLVNTFRPLRGTHLTPASWSDPWPYPGAFNTFYHVLPAHALFSKSISNHVLLHGLPAFWSPPAPSLYIIDEQQEPRVVFWPFRDNTLGLMGFQCKAELK